MSLPSKTVKPKFAANARSLKGEAQLFLDQFFRALGHGDVQEADAVSEYRTAKKPGGAQFKLITGQPTAKTKGGKKFGNMLWLDHMPIEMKKRDEDLEIQCSRIFDC